MTQNKKVVKTKAGAKFNDIELTDATIILDDKGGILKVILKNQTSNFFIQSKDVDINIGFTFGNGIHITAWQDHGQTEIKKLSFDSVTKNKNLIIKLNKLIDDAKVVKTCPILEKLKDCAECPNADEDCLMIKTRNRV